MAVRFDRSHLPFRLTRGAESHARIQALSAVLGARLKCCSGRQIEMLIRYYVHGQDENEVLAEMGASPEEFRQLRKIMRMPVASERSAGRPKARSASAG